MRLVARIFRFAALESSLSTTEADSRTCSRLSSNRSVCLSRRNPSSNSSGGWAPPSLSPSTRAMVGATNVGSVMAAIGTKKTPSSKSSTSSAATCSPTRVFPVPPVPKRVKSLVSGLRNSPHRLHLPLAPDARCCLQGQVVGVGFQGLQGRELRRQVGSRKLEDPLGPGEIFEAPLPQVSQMCLRRQVIPHQLLGRRREEYLPAVTGREQPRHPVHRWAEVVAISFMGGACVQRRPRPEGADLIPPRLREETPLGRKRRLQGAEGSRENRAEGVAYSLEDETTVPFYGLPEDGVVTSQGDLHASGALLPQLRRTLYVCKQEGNGAGGQIGHKLLSFLLCLNTTI